ncbi:MAG: 50S ribosomal protein L25 [Gemmatimonadota bacterium]
MAVQLTVHQREEIALSIAERAERGNGPVGRLRREQGMLPGVVYGHRRAPFSFRIATLALERALSSGGSNAIFVLQHEGDGEVERAVVREIQYHKVRGDILHVDFLRIDPDEVITVSVPIHTVGTPVGVRIGGGAVQHSLNELEMECVASELPSRVEIDIADLEIGDSIHVRDLLDQEKRIVTEPEITIVSVLSPRLTIDEELAKVAEAEALGVVAEPGEAVEGAVAEGEAEVGDEK